MSTLIRWITGAAIVFLVWELSARVEDWWVAGAALLGRYDYTQLSEVDELGPHGKPHARYLKWKLNSLGFRGPELGANRRRVMIIGASESFGLYESAGHEYPRLLEQELRHQPGGDDLEVVNAAFAGQGLPALTRRLDRIAPEVRPRWALIYPSLANYISPPPPFQPLKPPFPKPSGWHIRSLERIDAVVKRSLPLSLSTAIKTALIWKAERGLTQPVMTRIPESRVELFDTEVMALAGKLQAHGVQPVLATHATYFGPVLQTPYRDMLISWRKFYPELSEDGFLDMEARLNERVRVIARREGFTLIDVAKEMPSGPRMFADFCHFTDEGARQMAGILARRMQPLLGSAGRELQALEATHDGRAKAQGR